MKQVFGMVFLSCFTSIVFCQNKALEIKYMSNEIIIDGKQDDWPDAELVIPSGDHLPYINKNNAALAWDENNLYVFFSIQDHKLCTHESGNNNPRLYLNDGIEIYIDTKGDSRSKMDKNDYQIMISIPDYYTVFKGDIYLIKEGYQVPKDYENHTLIFEKSISVSGTINENSDFDSGYTVEAAIPWQSLGIKPKRGYTFKMDLCVNDVDTVVNMISMPDNWHPSAINTINYQGKTDYGFPDFWTMATLTGKPGAAIQLKQFIQRHWQFSYSFLLLMFTISGYIIFKQFKKIRFYQNFPTRIQLENLSSTTVQSGSIIKQHISPNKTDEIPDQVFEMKKYITDNIQNNISLHLLCNHVHLGDRQLQRLCKLYYGVSPMQLVNKMKLEAAEKLLMNTNYTVSEVAYHFAFEDAGYFSNLFKKYYGTSPHQYRKNKVNGNHNSSQTLI